MISRRHLESHEKNAGLVWNELITDEQSVARFELDQMRQDEKCVSPLFHGITWIIGKDIWTKIN